jgi:hypothetical protein
LYPGELTAFFAALAWVFLVVGGSATLKTTQLAFASGVAHAWRRHGAGGCETVSFGTNDLCHEITPINCGNPALSQDLAGGVFL